MEASSTQHRRPGASCFTRAQIGRAALLLAFALVACDSRFVRAEPEGIEINIDISQRATVVGRSSSLRTLLEELCWRSGATLQYFDAVDRAVGGTYRNVPLTKLIRRLLSHESYMVGTTTDPVTKNERLLWVKVLGDPATAAMRRASGAGPSVRAPLQVPPLLLQTALSAPGQDPSEKQGALALLAARIGSDPREFQAFLATDARLIAEAIVRFDRAAESLTELRGRYSDPRVTAKIDQIIAELAALKKP